MVKNASLSIETLRLDIHVQPNDETCGPTALHAVYRYFDDEITLQEVIQEVKTLQTGGTLAVLLGSHALGRGYEATLYTYNLKMFDPSWFRGTKSLTDNLREQQAFKNSKRFQFASLAYIRFLEQGGQIKFQDLNEGLIEGVLRKATPILTGLSATYLYDCPREIGATNSYDSIKGDPVGHFVVIKGYDLTQKIVHIADPLDKNPISKGQYYKVDLQRLINSILLGILTYDANLLVIRPKQWHKNL